MMHYKYIPNFIIFYMKMENFIPIFSGQQLKQKRQNGCRSRKKFQSNLMKKN